MSILFKIFQNQTYKSSASTFDQMRRLFRSHERELFDKCHNAFDKYNYSIYIADVSFFDHQQNKTKRIEQNDSDDNLLWRALFIDVRKFVNKSFLFEKHKL